MKEKYVYTEKDLIKIIRYTGLLFLILVGFLTLIQISSAIEINETTTINSIKWEWNNYESPVNVYIDGELKEINSTAKMYSLYNLNDNEEHTIRIESETANATNTAITDYNPFNMYILLILAIYAILIILGFIQPIFTIISIIPILMVFYELLENITDMMVMFFIAILIPVTFCIYAFQIGNHT